MSVLSNRVSSSIAGGFRRFRGYSFALFVVAFVVLSCSGVLAQTNRAGLITQAIDESNRISLSGNTHPAVRQSADRGLVPSSTAANRMMLLLKRSPESELALQSFIQSLHDANSPNFHRWLTPVQFGAQWGAADSDMAAVTAWLQSHGFAVKGANQGKTEIEFSGTVGQIQEAFHTSIHLYEVNGEIHHANAADPQIPAALAAVVGGISTLNDFYPRSLARKGPAGIYDTQAHAVHRELTGQEFGQSFLYVGPADAATIYNTPNKALNPAATGATYDGTGAKIGIAGDSNISLAQVANYRSIFGLSGKVPQVVIDGSTAPTENGDAVEAYLDLEVAGGIAPGASVMFYTAADTDFAAGVNLAAARAVNDNLVDVLNVSFGECEGSLTSSGNLFYSSLWEQATTQGISVTVAAGDSGSAGCDLPTETEAKHGMQVNGLASTPYDIAVGGTDFAALAGPDGSGADFTNYASQGSAPGTLRSALGYIPEASWNDSLYNYPPQQFEFSSPQPEEYASLYAAGGGKSNCASGSVSGGNLTCLKGYAKPAWQSGNGVPHDQVRDMPDLALFTGDGLYGAAWGICTDQDTDVNQNPIEDCTRGSNGLPANQFYIEPVGGTSASAPAFAGILALVRQATGQRQGQANYVLYSLAGKAPAAFHDVVMGNNSVPCAQGSADCLKNSEGNDFVNGYNATTGYDLASGLGSVNASALVASWANAGLVATTTQFTLSPDTQGHGAPIKVDITVASSGGEASGSVSLTALANPPSLPEGVTIGSYPLLANGSTGPLEIVDFPGGTYTVVATYGGSGTHQGSTSAPQTVTIAPEPTTTQLIVTAINPSTGDQVAVAQYGYPVGLAATLCGARSHLGGPNDSCQDGTPTGSVTFADGYDVLGSAPLSSLGVAKFDAPFRKPGLHGFSVHYDGDNSYKAVYGLKTNLLIEKGPTNLTLKSSGTAYAGSPIVFTVEMTTNSAGAEPTGMVQLVQGKTVIASVALAGVAGGKNLASGTATISTSNLPPGTNPTEAVYVGDVNYAASTSNSLEIKGKAIFSLTGTTVSLPAEHSTASALMPLNSEGGYAGTVNFTCQLVGINKEAAPPACGMYPAAVTLTAGEKTDANMLLFGKGTKLPTGVTLGSNTGGTSRWMVSGGAVLVCFSLLFGIPARHRKWKTMLSVLLLLIAISGATACSSSAKLVSTGSYTFQVTGTDSVDSSITKTVVVHVSVL